jgi:hypothetical protein
MFLFPFFGGVDNNNSQIYEEENRRDYDSDISKEDIESLPYQNKPTYTSDIDDEQNSNYYSDYSDNNNKIEGGFNIFSHDPQNIPDFDLYSESDFINVDNNNSDSDVNVNVNIDNNTDSDSDDSDDIKIEDTVELSQNKKGGNESDTKHSGIDIYTGIDIANDIEEEEHIKTGGNDIMIEDPVPKHFLIFTGANIARDLGYTVAT